MGLQAKMRAIRSHALCWMRGRLTCEYSFTLLKLQSAELTLLNSRFGSLSLRTYKRYQSSSMERCSSFPSHNPVYPFLISIPFKTGYFTYFLKLIHLSFFFFFPRSHHYLQDNHHISISELKHSLQYRINYQSSSTVLTKRIIHILILNTMSFSDPLR